MNYQELENIINRFLKINSSAIKARDVISEINVERLRSLVAYLIGKIDENKKVLD